MVTTVPGQRARLLERFPELADYARPAYRLHPRPGAPVVTDSSVGGPLLWPSEEAWPVCTEPHVTGRAARTTDAAAREEREREVASRAAQVERLEALGPVAPEGILRAARESLARARAAVPTAVSVASHAAAPSVEPVVTVPVLQIFKSDIPDHLFAADSDILQVLWCPQRHQPGWLPRPVVVWRRAADVVNPLESPPEANDYYKEGYLPSPCVIHPEAVTEYPPVCTLQPGDPGYRPLGLMPPELEAQVRAWSGQMPAGQDYPSLAHAPGWKILGWEASGPDNRHLAACECGEPGRVLLDTFRSEDLGGIWAPSGAPGFRWGEPDDWEDQEPTGVDIARDGAVWIRTCSSSREHPLEIGAR